MRRHETSALSLPAGKSDRLIPDGTVPGLALRSRHSGNRTWIFQYRIGNKQHRMTLGSATVISVARRRANLAQRNEDAETVKARLPLFLARPQDRVRDGHLRPRPYDEPHLLLHGRRLHAKHLAAVNRRAVPALVGYEGGTTCRYNRALYRAEKAAALARWAEYRARGCRMSHAKRRTSKPIT